MKKSYKTTSRQRTILELGKQLSAVLDNELSVFPHFFTFHDKFGRHEVNSPIALEIPDVYRLFTSPTSQALQGARSDVIAIPMPLDTPWI